MLRREENPNFYKNKAQNWIKMFRATSKEYPPIEIQNVSIGNSSYSKVYDHWFLKTTPLFHIISNLY